MINSDSDSPNEAPLLRRLWESEYGHDAANADGSIEHGKLFVDGDGFVRWVSDQKRADERTEAGDSPMARAGFALHTLAALEGGDDA